MNRKRRIQNFGGFGLVRTKTYTTNRVPKDPFEKIKTIYGNHLHGSHGEIQASSFGKISLSPKVNQLIYKEKARQLSSYIIHGVLILFAFILLIFVMNSSYN